MATLTQVAINTRRTIKYSIYLIIFLILARFAFGITWGIYRGFFPKPPPPPTIAFGKLPPISFPQGADPNLEYRIETVEGGLPKLAPQATVYFMPQLSANLGSLDVAQEKASRLGFNQGPEEVSSTIYRFRKDDAPALLEMNIATGIFSLSYDLASDTSVLENLPPTPEVAASQVRSLLSAGGILPEDLTGRTIHEFLRAEGGNLTTVTSLSEADLTRVDLFRSDYNDLPVVTATPGRANVWFLVSGSRSRDKAVIGGEFHYFPIDSEQAATYPLKTSLEALEALKAGQGYIADRGQNENGEIVVRRVYLAYFDPGNQSQYFQPVFVFEGDRNFTAYVPAISGEYYSE